MNHERERCPVCDRVTASEAEYQDWRNDPARPVGTPPPSTECYGWVRVGESECRARAVDWRSRALSAEARIRDVLDMLQPGRILYLDSFQTIRRILTRDPVPETARKPETEVKP